MSAAFWPLTAFSNNNCSIELSVTISWQSSDLPANVIQDGEKNNA